MEGKSIEITYETLFDLLKREKDRGELQKLEPTFFNDLLEYVKRELEDKAGVSLRQRDNLKKILKELYERREKKIIGMALDKSRTNSNLVDTSSLLQEEKVIYETVVGLLNHFRKNTLGSILSGKQPLLKMHELSVTKDFKSAASIEKEESEAEGEKEKLVRFLHAVPKFIGTELEEYGPFQVEDMSKLPTEIANVLISKGRAEEIKEN